MAKIGHNESTGLIVLDFAINHSSFVQDAMQDFHWNNSQATLHPVVIYYNNSKEMKHPSICFISNHMNQDSVCIYAFRRIAVDYVKEVLPHINKVIHFTEGCAAQYKNCKNFSNLCHHENDFGFTATWNFFATSHCKNACDGIGGTTKRRVALASL